MARVLVAGCGYVGEAAANAFHENGWGVEGWTGTAESAAKLSDRPYPVKAVDVTSRSAVEEASGQIDVVIHCVSSHGGDEEQYRRLYFEGAQNLLHAFSSAALLFTSSTSVYAQRDGSVVDESSPAEPPHEKGKILRETEELVLAAGGIVARLGGIHGPQRSFFLTRFLQGTFIGGPNDRLINQVHRDDIVSALLLLANRRAACAAEIFNVVADQPIKASVAREWLGARLGNRERRGAEEDGQVRPRKRGESNKQVSNRKLRALGWEPRYPTFEIAMTESILPSFGF
jgi:nucleoside-diphosphate-sugar epimerase